MDGIEEVRAVAPGGVELRFQPAGKTRLGQQAPGLLGIVLIVFRARAELIDGQRPLGEATGDGRGRLPPEGYGLDQPLPIDGVGEGAADPHVMKGGLIGAHIEHLGDGGQEILVAQVGMTTFEGVEILLADGRKLPPCPGPQSSWPVRYIASAVDGSSSTNHSTRSTYGWSWRKYAGWRVNTVFTLGS